MKNDHTIGGTRRCGRYLFTDFIGSAPLFLDFVPFANAEAAHAKWGNSTLKELSSQGHFALNMEFMLKYMGLWDLIQL